MFDVDIVLNSEIWQQIYDFHKIGYIKMKYILIEK